MSTDVQQSVKPLSRSRKSAEKRDAIIRAAINIINAKSYALASMTEIAASLDLRDAALYYYFPNKRALVYACHVHSLGRFERFIDEAEAGGGTGAEKLERFIGNFLGDSSTSGPLLYFGDYSYLEARQRESIDAWADKLSRLLQRFLDEGMADGTVVRCESALVVQLLLGMLIWLGKWVPKIEDMTVERLMDAIGAFCLHGVESRDQPRQ